MPIFGRSPILMYILKTGKKIIWALFSLLLSLGNY